MRGLYFFAFVCIFLHLFALFAFICILISVEFGHVDIGALCSPIKACFRGSYFCRRNLLKCAAPPSTGKFLGVPEISVLNLNGFDFLLFGNPILTTLKYFGLGLCFWYFCVYLFFFVFLAFICIYVHFDIGGIWAC